MAERAEELRIQVKDFGVIPGTEVDCGPGLRKALEAAKEAGRAATLVFDEGVYRIGAEIRAGVWGPRAALYLEDASDIRIQGGSNTRLVIIDPEAAGLVLNNCRNVVVADIEIDYAPLPFAQGSIVSIDLDRQFFCLKLDEGRQYLDFNHSAFANAQSVLGFTVRDEPSLKEANVPVYGPIVIGARPAEEISPGIWRLEVNPELSWGTSRNKYTGYSDALRRAKLVPGDRYIHWARAYTAAVTILASSEVECLRVRVRASPGITFFPHVSSRVTLDGCEVAPPAGSSRLISTNADGIHARGMRGPLIVRNCRFEALGDDAINIHASPLRPLESVAPGVVTFRPHTFSVRPGDFLEQYFPDTAKTTGPFLVASVSRPEGSRGPWQVEFAREAAPDLTPEALRGTVFYNLSEAGAGFEIRGNYFGPHRGRGVLLSARDGIIEGNTFRNREVGSGWGIVLHHETSIWAEGPVARDISIARNLFFGPGGKEAAIKVYRVKLPEGKRPEEPVHTGLRIEGNTFRNLNGPAALVYDIPGVVLRENTVERDDAFGKAGALPSAFTLHSCPGAEFARNTCSDPVFEKPIIADER